MSKIFISGPSGVGKTTLGKTLSKEYNWIHVDCELLHSKYKINWEESYKEILLNKKNIVLTWGMLKKHFFIADTILSLGFNYIWLSGNEELINQSLINRGEDLSFIKSPIRQQTKNIIKLKDPDEIIEVFNEDGTRKNIAEYINNKYWTS
jgi:broad-specificity NMP kinase